MAGKHGPNTLDNYINVHQSAMAKLLAEGFAVRDDCRFIFTPELVLLEGEVVCLDRVVLEVYKELEILSGRGRTAQVQTRKFSYHARGEHNIFRYDSPHGHRPYPHKHVYDPFAPNAQPTIQELKNEDDIPVLNEVVYELERWHAENAYRLRRS